MAATRVCLALLFGLGVLAPKLAVAQRTAVRDYYRGYPRTTHASTARESYSYGRAAEIWAKGWQDLLTSKAWINEQEAYGMYLANRGLATRTYFENRALNRMYRRMERGPRPTRAQIERMAKMGRAKQLSPSELDPATGTITWPMVLAELEFSKNRQQIESFFKQRTQPDFRPNLAAHQRVLNAIGQMRTKLRNHVYHVDPGQYVVARKFLDSLTEEVRRKE